MTVAGPAVARGPARDGATTRAACTLAKSGRGVLVVAALAGLAALRCAPAHEPALATVSLRMSGGPPDSIVTIDDEPVGSLDFVMAHGVALPPGPHTITVQARGYLPMDRAIEAKPGSPPLVLVVALTPVPD